MQKYSKIQPSITGHDQVLAMVVFMLMMFGAVMVYSASVALPDAPKYASYSRWHFLIRQMISIAIVVGAGWAVYRVPTNIWQQHAMVITFISILLLALVLIPGVGKGVNGARRWLFIGVLSFQPSELMKLVMVLYATGYAVRRQAVMHSLLKGFGPMAIVITLIGGLLLLEPDLGALVVIVAIAMGILFIGGFNAIWFAGLSTLLASVFGLVIYLSPWRRERLFAYLNPWEEDNALGKAYQLSHSLIAYGRGGFFGVGLGGSVEKLHYLPEAHTDFLMAVVGEEFGLVGIAVVIYLFYFVIKRCFQIGRTAVGMDRYFAGIVAQGIGIWIGVQAVINIAVTVGALPTKGLTLPFMSYGGSGILMNCIGIAIVLRIDHETKLLMFGSGKQK